MSKSYNGELCVNATWAKKLCFHCWLSHWLSIIITVPVEQSEMKADLFRSHGVDAKLTIVVCIMPLELKSSVFIDDCSTSCLWSLQFQWNNENRAFHLTWHWCNAHHCHDVPWKLVFTCSSGDASSCGGPASVSPTLPYMPYSRVWYQYHGSAHSNADVNLTILRTTSHTWGQVQFFSVLSGVIASWMLKKILQFCRVHFNWSWFFCELAIPTPRWEGLLVHNKLINFCLLLIHC